MNNKLQEVRNSKGLRTPEAKDSWDSTGLVFFIQGQGYGITPELQTICLGKEDEVQEYLTGGPVPTGIAESALPILKKIKAYKAYREIKELFLAIGYGSQRYTDRQKLYALSLIDNSGVRGTSRILHLSSRTIQRWCRKYGKQVNRCPPWVLGWAETRSYVAPTIEAHLLAPLNNKLQTKQKKAA